MRTAYCLLLTAHLLAPMLHGQRRVELNDLGRQVNVANPRLSPDGKSALIVLVRTNYTDNRFERARLYANIAITSGLSPPKISACSSASSAAPKSPCRS